MHRPGQGHKVGTLIISPTKAELKRDTDFFTKMDPYVVVTLGHAKKKTEVHNHGGKKPVWSSS